MSYNTIFLSKKEGVGTITLNRPEILNGITIEMSHELLRMTTEVAADNEIRTVVVTGAGRAFSAGADLKSDVFDAKSAEEVRERTIVIGQALMNLRNMPKPIIAAVNGPAVGGGCNLALACDIIIASDKASFGEVFSKIAVHPDMGGTYFLTRLVGIAKACELVFTGKIIDAKEAERIGMVNQVVPHEEFEAAVMNLALSLAKGPPIVLALAKASLYQAMDMDLRSAIEHEARAVALSVFTEDRVEGVKAFLEKRKPVFKGK